MKINDVKTKKVFRMGMLTMVLVLGLTVVGCDYDVNEGRIVTGVVVTLMQGATSNQDSVHITWNSASAATHYEIAYRTEMDSLDTRLSVVSSHNNTTYTHTGYIRNRGPLTYYVRAHGSTTNSDGFSTPWTGPWAMSSEVDVDIP
jgi:ABC-type sulfate/molybdate transport systems ATPase subunit